MWHVAQPKHKALLWILCICLTSWDAAAAMQNAPTILFQSSSCWPSRFQNFALDFSVQNLLTADQVCISLTDTKSGQKIRSIDFHLERTSGNQFFVFLKKAPELQSLDLRLEVRVTRKGETIRAHKTLPIEQDCTSPVVLPDSFQSWESQLELGNNTNLTCLNGSSPANHNPSSSKNTLRYVLGGLGAGALAALAGGGGGGSDPSPPPTVTTRTGRIEVQALSNGQILPRLSSSGTGTDVTFTQSQTSQDFALDLEVACLELLAAAIPRQTELQLEFVLTDPIAGIDLNSVDPSRLPTGITLGTTSAMGISLFLDADFVAGLQRSPRESYRYNCAGGGMSFTVRIEGRARTTN